MKNKVPKLRFPEFSGKWKEHSLEKIAEVNPKTGGVPEKFIYVDLESVENGLLKNENIILKNEAPSRAQRVLENNDILYQTVRPYQKNNFYFESANKIYPFVASTGYAQLRTSQSSKYLYHFLHTDKFVDSVLERCTGTSYPAINSSDLKLIKINIPSLPEQEKIANFLSSMDIKIDKLEKKKELLEKYKKGMMQKLFSQKLRFKDDNGNDYPEWEEKKLGEISDVRDGTHDSPKYIEKGYPFITSKNLMANGQINFKDINYISKEDYISINKRSQVTKGDILFGMIGTIGNPVIVTKEGFAIKNVALIKEKDNLKNNFLLQLLKSSITEKQFHVLNVGGTQKFISLGLIRDLKFNLPSLPEQEKIANFLSSIDRKIELVEEELEKNKEFKKGLLQQMFV